jgi:hypothetical protein
VRLATRKDDDAELFRIENYKFLDLWKRAYLKSCVRVTPQALREWFFSGMVAKGVNGSYVDAFWGRIQRSVLTKHYLDCFRDKLEEIYDKTNLKVLSWRSPPEYASRRIIVMLS